MQYLCTSSGKENSDQASPRPPVPFFFSPRRYVSILVKFPGTSSSLLVCWEYDGGDAKGLARGTTMQIILLFVDFWLGE